MSSRPETSVPNTLQGARGMLRPQSLRGSGQRTRQVLKAIEDVTARHAASQRPSSLPTMLSPQAHVSCQSDLDAAGPGRAPETGVRRAETPLPALGCRPASAGAAMGYPAPGLTSRERIQRKSGREPRNTSGSQWDGREPRKRLGLTVGWRGSERCPWGQAARGRASRKPCWSHPCPAAP